MSNPHPPRPHEPLVDIPAQEGLAEALDPGEFAALVDAYLADLDASIGKVAAAVAAGAGPAIASAAHAVKGAAANLGFVRLSADAARIESMAKAGQADVAVQLDTLRITAAQTVAAARARRPA